MAQDKEKNAHVFIDAINEDFDYPYISEEDRDLVIETITQTRDTMADFMKHQHHYETRKTSKGVIEVFVIAGSRELLVMDFGDYRLAMRD